jgi:hypothetical protein
MECYLSKDECANRDWCLHVVHGMNITEWFRANYST